jgi:hypothetical protein
MRKQILAVLLLSIISPLCYGVIAPSTMWEVWPTSGSDTNGGGFSWKVGSTTSITDLAIDATLNTKVTSAAHGSLFTAGMIICVTAGTGFNTGCYQITSVVSSAAILDHVVGTVSSISGTASLYPGIDRSQQSGAQVTIDNSAVTATCNTNTVTFTGATYTPTSADVGNIMQFPAGITNITAGFYEINAETSTTWTITGAASACTAAANTVTLGTGSVASKMGGALATIAGVSAMVAGNNEWVKATGTLTVSATTTLALTNTVSNTVPPIRIYGYTSTRGDGGQVTIQPNTTGLTVLTVSGQGYDIANFFIDGSNGGNTVGDCILASGANNMFSNIKCGTFTAIGISDTGGSFSIVDSLFVSGQSGCTANISAPSGGGIGSILRNTITSSACIGINTSIAGVAVAFNLIYGSAVDCIVASGRQTILNNTLDGCLIGIVGNGSNAGNALQAKNNLISNSTTGLEVWTSAGWPAKRGFDGNCYYNNTTNRVNSDDQGTTNGQDGYPYINTLDQYLLTSPYVDDTHASGNYAIKTSGGAFETGTPGALPGVSQVGSMSCGALVPLAPSGTSGGVLSNSQMSNSRFE